MTRADEFDTRFAVMGFWVAGIPQTKGSWRIAWRGKRVFLVPDNDAEPGWSDAVAWAAKQRAAGLRHKADDRRYAVTLEFTLPAPKGRKGRRDVDKLARSCLDAMTKLIWVDDEQVDDLVTRKRVGDKAGVNVTITAL